MIIIFVILLITLIFYKRKRVSKYVSKKTKVPIFTQGLIVTGENMIESGGLYKESKIIEYSLTNHKKIIRTLVLDKKIFAEGITKINNELFLLTWKEDKAFIIDYDTFKIKKEIENFNSNLDSNEGWGCTYDTNKNEIIVSDGTHKIYFIDPITYLKKREIKTKYKLLNELEYINGFIYANIWKTNKIVKLDPQTGNCLQEFNININIKLKDRFKGVLNGIAYDQVQNKIYLTGKNWSTMYSLPLDHLK
ncbi:Glutamine cyclotransferase [seawater metagenome]|uniref:Glutamine cyclotransferase n=1 Tax=seawater metagenome TaxID=1561972 RepID=A0A5E8CKM8_9ZZZZ